MTGTRRSDLRLLGRTYGTSFRSDVWRSVHPVGLPCVAVSASFHLYALVTLGTSFVSGSTTAISLYAALYVPLSALALWSLYATWSSDPGAVPWGARPLPEHGAIIWAGAAATAEEGRRPPRMAEETEEAVTPNNEKEGTSGVVDAAVEEGGRGADASERTSSSTEARGEGASGADGGPPDAAVVVASPAIPPERTCSRCDNNYKPPRAHHCRHTGRCVVKLDHYCPWVGNAVGIGNHKHFVLFVLYTTLASVTSAALLWMRAVRCSYDGLMGFGWGQYDATVPGCVDPRSFQATSLSIMTAWFAVFAGLMLCSQAEVMSGGPAEVERLQERRRRRRRGGSGSPLFSEAHLVPLPRPQCTEVNEMFGGRGFTWTRLLPTPVQFPPGTREDILGYLSSQKEVSM